MKITYTYDNVKLQMNDEALSVLIIISGKEYINQRYRFRGYYQKQRDMYLKRLKMIKKIENKQIKITLS